ncbi:MAG TPA: hypothetical protein VG757_10815 [Devosia sp.]|nr:hypothetical protein [Devosia sp.]
MTQTQALKALAAGWIFRFRAEHPRSRRRLADLDMLSLSPHLKRDLGIHERRADSPAWH